ncbi:MAG: TolC family protein, partial [Burkholderiaceae bacterium]
LRAKARQAVREVEEALVNLESSAQRNGDAQAAATGYQAALSAAQARYKAGLGSLIELEDARRTAVLAQQNLLGLERDRIAAWIALYRAAGGGWTADNTVRFDARGNALAQP